MRPNSLAVRLIAISALLTALAVVAAGVILTSLYRQAVERSFGENLANYQIVLQGAIAQNTEELADPGNLGGDPRFTNIGSGWYWQISQVGDVLRTSPSLGFDAIAVPPNAVEDEAGDLHFTTTGPGGEIIRGVSHRQAFAELGAILDLVVTGNATAIEAEIGAFRRSVILTLAAFGIGLVIATFGMVRWGLRPLDGVRRGLADLRTGQATRFHGSYPAEIEPLANELNALLDSNQQIIERARTHVGNLAHALKTPLSVITNEARAAKGPLGHKVADQAELMSKQISHYLDRARIAARSQVIGAVTEVEPVVARLARAMRRIYDQKGLAITTTVPAGTLFRGEQQDFEEIVGNLTDNACKWAKGKVAISVDYERPPPAAENGRLTVRIDDDGPGLTPEQAAEATRRGRRLDESKPGSGLGLSIVTDLVGLYQGTFRMLAAPGGGLRAEVVLPAA